MPLLFGDCEKVSTHMMIWHTAPSKVIRENQPVGAKFGGKQILQYGILQQKHYFPIIDDVERPNSRSLVCPIEGCYMVFQTRDREGKVESDNYDWFKRQKCNKLTIFIMHLIEKHTDEELFVYGYKREYLIQ